MALRGVRPQVKPVEKLIKLPAFTLLRIMKLKWSLTEFVLVISLPKKVMDLTWVRKHSLAQAEGVYWTSSLAPIKQSFIQGNKHDWAL